MEIETLAGLFFPIPRSLTLLLAHSDCHTPPPPTTLQILLLPFAFVVRTVPANQCLRPERLAGSYCSGVLSRHLPPFLHPTWDAFPSGSSAGHAERWKPFTPRYHCDKVWESHVHCRPWWTVAMCALQLARCMLTAYGLLALHSNITTNRGVSHALHTKRDVEVSRKQDVTNIVVWKTWLRVFSPASNCLSGCNCSRLHLLIRNKYEDSCSR